LTFTEEPPAPEAYASQFRAIREQGRPYLVAATSAADIVGYCYAAGFRAAKGAYRHTVELTLFCHPDHLGKGIGSRLLTELLASMRDPASHQCYFQGRDLSLDPGIAPVRQVLAVMAVDDEGPGSGLALKAFYERFGFELVRADPRRQSFPAH
jgi:GNAT superfamily N-acetyltransferase